ncbi:uncharacterized protein LOC122643494 [Telopea speciosissima]|uniref:uncharacterized protein LOC122643494 n=1 Tax=Telopea speciosissima TaxID=54955 RepID=UPI001CC634B0|nr:uncharacterized protein LOC122643494 [Telopea speciosissima]
MDLTQGSQLVMICERKFEELSRYAPHMVGTKEMKARQFKQGTKSISPMQLKTYAKVVHKSQIYEAMEKNATKDEEVEPKKKFKKSFAAPTTNKGNWKKVHKKKPQLTARSMDQLERNPQGGQANQNAQNRRDTQGNQKPRASRRVFAMTQKDAKASPSVVAGMLKFFGIPAYLCVSTPFGGMIETELVCESCDVEIMDRKLTTYLILLEMKDFDVILGMDWLAACHASVLCFEKRMVMRPVKEPEFKLFEMMIITPP